MPDVKPITSASSANLLSGRELLLIAKSLEYTITRTIDPDLQEEMRVLAVWARARSQYKRNMHKVASKKYRAKLKEEVG